jgi:hypothetical protein
VVHLVLQDHQALMAIAVNLQHPVHQAVQDRQVLPVYHNLQASAAQADLLDLVVLLVQVVMIVVVVQVDHQGVRDLLALVAHLVLVD